MKNMKIYCQQRMNKSGSTSTNQMYVSQWGLIGAGRCHCKATLVYLWMVTEIGRETWRQGENKYHSYSRGEERRFGELQAVQPHLSPWEDDGENPLEIFFKNMKDKEQLGIISMDLWRAKSCLTNLIDYYNDVNSSVHECRAVDIVYLYLRKAFYTASHNITIDKLKN